MLACIVVAGFVVAVVAGVLFLLLSRCCWRRPIVLASHNGSPFAFKRIISTMGIFGKLYQLLLLFVVVVVECFVVCFVVAFLLLLSTGLLLPGLLFLSLLLSSTNYFCFSQWWFYIDSQFIILASHNGSSVAFNRNASTMGKPPL